MGNDESARLSFQQLRTLAIVLGVALAACSSEETAPQAAARSEVPTTVLIEGSATSQPEVEPPSNTERQPPSSDNSPCDSVKDVPFEDCVGLLRLSESVGHRSWFQTDEACDWDWLTCENSRVVEIRIHEAPSGGTLSVGSEPGTLSELRHLSVEGVVNRPNSSNPIIIEDGGIAEVAADINGLENLEELALYGEEELALPDEMSGLRSLQRLRLVGFSNSVVPSAAFDLDLDFSVLQLPNLTEFEVPLASWANLERLYITQSSLHYENVSLGPATSIEVLTIQESPLEAVPVDIFRLSELQTLRMPRSSLRSVHGDWPALGRLSILELTDNELVTVPESMFVDTLTWLELGNNQLESVPDEIKDPDFEWLHLGSNNLSSVPLGLFDKPINFSLSGNAFEGDVTELVAAYLSGNARAEFQLASLGCVEIKDDAIRAKFEAEVLTAHFLSSC